MPDIQSINSDPGMPRPMGVYRRSLDLFLEGFEGPLDLLLHLIRKEEIDIFDIPIAQVTRQYLDYLGLMKDLNVNLAGEWLVMASTLILIKSKMLLPVDPALLESEDFEDPRQELVDRLLEYEKFKNAAHLLYERETVELSVWPRGFDEFEEDEKEMVDADLYDLVKAFSRIVERYKEKVVLRVDPEPATLEDKLQELRRLLSMQKEYFFSWFLEKGLTRFHLVLTFVALLEMVRCQEVRLVQKAAFQDIRIVAC